MGAKKIRKRRSFLAPDTARVNRALHAIVEFGAVQWPRDTAPVPIFELNGPLPGPNDEESPIPAIRPELVDPIIILEDPHIVADFQKTGLHMARIADPDMEKVLVWLIDKSRSLDARKVDREFAIDFGHEIRDREMGGTLAGLTRNGRARVIASSDETKVIVQMILRPEDYAGGRDAIEAEHHRLFPSKLQ